MPSVIAAIFIISSLAAGTLTQAVALMILKSPPVTLPVLAKETDDVNQEYFDRLNLQLSSIAGRTTSSIHKSLFEKVEQMDTQLILVDTNKDSLFCAMAHNHGIFRSLITLDSRINPAMFQPPLLRELFPKGLDVNEPTNRMMNISRIVGDILEPLNPERPPEVLKRVREELQQIDEEIIEEMKPLLGIIDQVTARGFTRIKPIKVQTFQDLHQFCEAYIWADIRGQSVLEHQTKLICKMAIRLEKYRYFRSPVLKKMIMAEFYSKFWERIFRSLKQGRSAYLGLIDSGIYKAAFMTLMIRESENFFLGNLGVPPMSPAFGGATLSGAGLLLPDSEIQVSFAIRDKEFVEITAMVDNRPLHMCGSKVCTLQEFEQLFAPYAGLSTEVILGLSSGPSFLESQAFLFGVIMFTSWVILILMGMLYTTVQRIKLLKQKDRNEVDNFDAMEPRFEEPIEG